MITGRSAFLSLLEREGVTHLFGNPGTTELPIMAALGEHPSMRYVLGLQESIVVAMADGFSRASGRLSACNVHVAPGLGNAMGSIFNANWIGSPIIVTAGQQEQGHGLTEPLLYGPLIPMASPVVKWATEVNRLADLPRIVRRAAKIATAPPTGPVFISLPGDILNDQAELPDLGADPTRVDALTRPNDASLAALADLLANAKRLAIIAGHELASGDCLAEAGELAHCLGAPVYQQTVPHGAHFLSEHDCFMGTLSRNQVQVSNTLSPFDTLLLLGADQLRMSVWSNVDPMPQGISILQIGERSHELAKNYPTRMALQAHAGETIRALLPFLKQRVDPNAAAGRVAELKTNNWRHQRLQHVESAQRLAEHEPIANEVLMMRVVEAVAENTVVVDEGLTASQSLLRFLPQRDSRGYFGLASGGIGFAIAGVIGMQLAQPDRPHLAIIGDGSAMYSIQALWTAAHLNLPITFLIANNHSYRILKQRVQAFTHGDGRDPPYIGMDFNAPAIDFVALAQSMGVAATRVEHPNDIAPALARAQQSGAVHLLDVHVDPSV